MTGPHSDGPWHGLPRGAFGMLTVCDAHARPVAHVTESSFEHNDWRLIAAAPEMLAALRRLLDENDGCLCAVVAGDPPDVHSPGCEAARSALAKVERVS